MIRAARMLLFQVMMRQRSCREPLTGSPAEVTARCLKDGNSCPSKQRRAGIFSQHLMVELRAFQEASLLKEFLDRIETPGQ